MSSTLQEVKFAIKEAYMDPEKLVRLYLVRLSPLIMLMLRAACAVHRLSLRALSSSVAGIDINYETSGTGAHVVLLMPGVLGSTRTDFSPQLDKLPSVADQQLQLVAWDPPGVGYSRPPDRNFSADFYSEDAETAAAFMQKLGHERYSVMGWSDGGITAVIMAARYQERVNKMMIWGVNAFVTDEDIQLYEAIRDVDKWSERARAPMIELYGEDYFRRTWNTWIDAVSQYRHNPNGICKAECALVECPTLIVHGAKDALVPELHAHYFKRHIANNRLHVFPDGKHNLHLRYADEFNLLAAEFLTDRPC